ncbi:hypothetical protein CC79DRAFT_1197623 [Sarocladium strictum]
MTAEAKSPTGRSRHSTRTPTACEHCRATRMRCRPSEQVGVCARCLALRRECVTRTQSRPKRKTRASVNPTSAPSAVTLELPGHLGPFTINYTVPLRHEQHDLLGALHDLHSHVFSSIPHGGGLETASEEGTQSSQSSGKSAVSHRSDIDPNSWRQPLFDVASAETLLNSFRSTVSYLPFIKLPSDVTVAHLNFTKPFVLLAILTVASGAKMVQKHALYEDEFRKALSLKYVAGGEKNLELLQGVLIYCAWHPFQLRPKDGQLVHCLRIASSLVHELYSEEYFVTQSGALQGNNLDNHLDMTRAYLAYIYLMSTWAVLWRGKQDLPISHASWANTGAGILEQYAQTDGDYTLVSLVRTSSLFSRATEIIYEPEAQAVTNCQYLLSTLQQDCSAFHVRRGDTGAEAMQMQTMFVDIFLDCGGLLNFPVSTTYSNTNTSRSYPSMPRLYSAMKKIRSFLDYVEDLHDSSILSFTINNWTQLIAILTLSFRLSFPLPLCPDFDSGDARSVLRLDGFLDKMSRNGKAVPEASDLLSASRFVLGLAKKKYDARLAALSDSQPSRSFSRTLGCPMMTGNLKRTYAQSQSSSSNSGEGRVSFIYDAIHEA